MPPKGERRKQQIIDTAKEMFIEKGFQSTHIGQVCEKLNIARGTVYQYFSNKKEILYTLMDSVVEKIGDILDKDDFVEFIKSNDEASELYKFTHSRISSSLEVLIDEPIVIKLIFNQISGVDNEVLKKVDEFIYKIRNIMADGIMEIKKWGIFKDEINPSITASILFGGIMMLIYEHERKKVDVLDENTVKLIIDQYLDGSLSRERKIPDQ